MRRFIDEYFELSENQWLIPNYDSIKKDVQEHHEHGMKVEKIVEYLQERYYLFTDDVETEHITSVVKKMIYGMPVKNKFTGVEFK